MFLSFQRYRITNQSFNLKTILIFLATIVGANCEYTKNCHYSCAYCGSPYYSHCIICEQPFVLTPIKNAHNIKQFYNTLEEQPWGPCLGILPETNILGIFLVLTNVIALIYFRNRTIFYILSSFQTFSLFSFIQTAYTYPISYTLQSLEYFMFATSLNRPNREVRLQIFDDTRYRMWEFLNSYDFKSNFTIVFVLSIICFAIALFVPIARYFSKSQGSLWSICYCQKLQKIFTFFEIGSLVTFFLLLQQSIMIIFIGFFLDDKFENEAGNITMVVAYFLALIFMIGNVCMKSLQLFSNKVGQQIEILKKCIGPVFIALPVNGIIFVAGFVLIMDILGLIFAKLSSKSYKRSYFHQCLIKREMKYRIFGLIVTFSIIIYYFVQNQVKSYQSSSITGIISVIVMVVYFLCLIIESGIELYGKFYLKQTQELYQKSGFALTSLRPSKMLQQTIENFETTDEGILDMVFFSRNLTSQQNNKSNRKQKHTKKSYKKSNIHITLNQINQEVENDESQANDQQLKKFTPSVSPKHNRQLEKHLKAKTSRTPKNDKTTRFKLNKIVDNDQEIQNIEMENKQKPKISMTRQENDTQQIKDQNSTIMNDQNFFNAEKGSNPQIKIQIDAQAQEKSEIQEIENKQHQFQHNQQTEQDSKNIESKKAKNFRKNHILNINNSEQEGDSNFSESDKKEKSNKEISSTKNIQDKGPMLGNNKTKGFKAVKKHKKK